MMCAHQTDLANNRGGMILNYLSNKLVQNFGPKHQFHNKTLDLLILLHIISHFQAFLENVVQMPHEQYSPFGHDMVSGSYFVMTEPEFICMMF